MNILYEDSMPYAAEFFAELGECSSFSTGSLRAADLADVDVLLVRSTTKVNEDLLYQANKLTFVGTATAGTNHVDKEYLKERGIPFYSAAGCNAIAVAEYVVSALFVLAERLDWKLPEKNVGIVGAGHVGTALSSKLDALKVPYLLCDPPLAEAGDKRKFVDLQQIMQADVICLHVPFVESGDYPTNKMFDKARLEQLSEQQVLINACRGEVLDNHAALDLLEQGASLNLVLDVWDNEPDVLLPLLPHLQLATAHIAGHTIEGKARGTEILYAQLCQQMGVVAEKSISDFLPAAESLSLIDSNDALSLQRQAALQVYDIKKDDGIFRAQVKNAADFVNSRKNYAIRREFASTPISTGNSIHLKALYGLGFERAKPT